MNRGAESAADIDVVAAQWAARVDRAPLSTEDEAALDAWAAGDSRRLGAFARARAVVTHFERAKALGAGYDATQFGIALRQHPPRSWLTGMKALAAAAACFAIAVGLWLYLSAGSIATQRGEVRLVPLADGSAITLNTASTVTVQYSEGQRRVELVEGEVLFNVAKNPTRPFIVDAGNAQVHVLGTSFVVRREPGGVVHVLVREGAVEVRPAVGAAGQTVQLRANMRVEVSALESSRLNPIAVPEIEITRALAWRDGMISLDGITLREAAAEFARYSDVHIVIDDPAISERTVAGLFSAGNPVGFAQAVATSMGLKADVKQGSIILHH